MGDNKEQRSPSSNRRPEEHLRRYENGNVTLVNKGIVYFEKGAGSRKVRRLRDATTQLVTSDNNGPLTGIANKYVRLPELKRFDDAKAPYVLVQKGDQASWNGSFYTLPLTNQPSWDKVFGSHMTGGDHD
jgi:hypothetical protein